MFRKILYCLRCCVKITTFMFWASLCMMTMRLTLFRSSQPDTQREWMLPDNYSKILHHGAVNGEDSTEPEYNLEEDDYAVATEMAQRDWNVSHVCRKYGLTDQPLNSNEFFIDYKHKFVLCPIFKAASSTWLYKLNILGGYSKEFLLRTKAIQLNLARSKFPKPKENKLRSVLEDPEVTSVLFVREPFVRLLSAYRDKLENNTHKYYRKLVKSIISKYRTSATMLSKGRTKGPTFYEFVSHVIETHKNNKKYDNITLEFNEHWAPYYRFCSPCAVNFRIIGKVETLGRDTAYILRELGLDNELKAVLKETDRRIRKRTYNKSRDGLNTTILVRKYFSQLDENILNKLLQIYGIDFEMFGYDSKIYSTYIRK